MKQWSTGYALTKEMLTKEILNTLKSQEYTLCSLTVIFCIVKKTVKG